MSLSDWDSKSIDTTDRYLTARHSYISDCTHFCVIYSLLSTSSQLCADVSNYTVISQNSLNWFSVQFCQELFVRRTKFCNNYCESTHTWLVSLQKMTYIRLSLVTVYSLCGEIWTHLWCRSRHWRLPLPRLCETRQLDYQIWFTVWCTVFLGVCSLRTINRVMRCITLFGFIPCAPSVSFCYLLVWRLRESFVRSHCEAVCISRCSWWTCI